MQGSILRLSTAVLGLLWLLAPPANAQWRLGFNVDGDAKDWGGGVSGIVPVYDVQPVQVNSIDIAAYDGGGGLLPG